MRVMEYEDEVNLILRNLFDQFNALMQEALDRLESVNEKEDHDDEGA